MTEREKKAFLSYTDDERMLIQRAEELCKRGEDNGAATSFLTPREQRLVFEALKRTGDHNRTFFWGGYVGAQRRKAVFLPVWMETQPCAEGLFSAEREKNFLTTLESYGMTELCGEYLCAVQLLGSGYRELSHRDFLGALMSLGIKRSVLGDICVEGSTSRVFCERTAADYIESELTRAGRDTVKCSRVPIDLEYVPVQSFEEMSITVASLRLDGVVRALISVSRDDAASLVSRGEVELNYFTEKENDTAVQAKDIISVRGYGKYIIDSVGDLTRRGRIRVLARKYL